MIPTRQASIRRTMAPLLFFSKIFRPTKWITMTQIIRINARQYLWWLLHGRRLKHDSEGGGGIKHNTSQSVPILTDGRISLVEGVVIAIRRKRIQDGQRNDKNLLLLSIKVAKQIASYRWTEVWVAWSINIRNNYQEHVPSFLFGTYSLDNRIPGSRTEKDKPKKRLFGTP